MSIAMWPPAGSPRDPSFELDETKDSHRAGAGTDRGIMARDMASTTATVTVGPGGVGGGCGRGRRVRRAVDGAEAPQRTELRDAGAPQRAGERVDHPPVLPRAGRTDGVRGRGVVRQVVRCQRRRAARAATPMCPGRLAAPRRGPTQPAARGRYRPRPGRAGGSPNAAG